MDAYVINLEERTDRWDAIQKAFQDTGLTLHRINAIKDENGSYGCTMSFLKTIQMAKDKQLPSLLILEDDCLPGDNFKIRWPIIKKWLDEHPDEWEIINGGGIIDGCILYKCPEKDSCLFKAINMSSAHFIYIPQRMYDRVLAHPDKDKHTVTILVDGWLNNHFKTFAVYPFLGKTSDGHSNIEKKYRTDISVMTSGSEKHYQKCMELKTGGRRMRKKFKKTRKNRTKKRAKSRKNYKNAIP
jgi:hypothetical protein